MKATHFIGRKHLLEKLIELQQLPGAKLMVVKGRRRIGKSRLLQEYGDHFDTVAAFSGLPPSPGIGAAEQRLSFTNQLKHIFNLRGLQTDDWEDLFWHLGSQTQSGKVLIVLDEITWMAEGDPTFLPKLKNAWDMHFKNNPQLILALASSISVWIENNILASTGFLGRVSLDLTLDELTLQESLQFWDGQNASLSTLDKLILLSVTGGVPRYLEEINKKKTAEENLTRLCFDRDGILFNEFDAIFSDLFSKRNTIYKRIVQSLVDGCYEASQIAQAAHLAVSGDIYEYLDDLMTAGFIARDFSWHFKNGKLSKLRRYRLKDNYCRFYLKYIEPNKEKIKLNPVPLIQAAMLPQWSSFLGLQLENLVLQNRHLIKESLSINPASIICDNPYFQRKTQRQEGCQIDYLIQTQFNTLYICEIKYSKNPITSAIIKEVQNKIAKLTVPKNFSCIPVLIYFGELHETVEEAGYFRGLINIASFLDESLS